MLNIVCGAEVEAAMNQIVVEDGKGSGAGHAQRSAPGRIGKHQQNRLISLRLVVRNDWDPEGHSGFTIRKGQGTVGGNIILTGTSRAIEGGVID